MKILNKLRLKNNFTQMRDGYFVAFIANSFMFSTWAYAENDSSRYQHSFKESTNLNTAGYVWKFEVMPDPQLDTKLRIQLLNPHPQLKVLNQRALEIVQQITRQEFEAELIEMNNLLQQLPKTENLPTSIDHLTSKVRFIYGISYAKRQPKMTHITKAFTKLCSRLSDTHEKNDQSELPSYLGIHHLYDAKNDSFHLKLNLDVSQNGRITHYSTLPKLEHKELVAALTRDIRGIRFNAYNENGVPAAFRVQQPIGVQCA